MNQRGRSDGCITSALIGFCGLPIVENFRRRPLGALFNTHDRLKIVVWMIVPTVSACDKPDW